jgi:hypothetical protein
LFGSTRGRCRRSQSPLSASEGLDDFGRPDRHLRVDHELLGQSSSARANVWMMVSVGVQLVTQAGTTGERGQALGTGLVA